MGAHISKLVVCSALLTYGVTPGVMAKGSTGKGRLARYLTDAGSFPSTRQGLESTRPLTYDGPKKFPRRKFRAIVKKDRSPKEFDELVGRVWKSPSRCTNQFCKKDGPNDMACTCLDSDTDAPRPRRLKAWFRAIQNKKKCKYRTCRKVGPDGMTCQCRDSIPSTPWHHTHCVQQNEVNCEGTGVCNVVTVQICD